MDRPEIVRVLDVRTNNSSHRTFTLAKRVDARAGQFCMLWIPGVNEKPMSFSNISGYVDVTVKKVGRFTSHLFMLDKGSNIGFRGPYGRGFDYVAGEVCLVGGGCGIAPLRPLKDKLRGHVIIAAKNADNIMFEGDFVEAGFEVHTATDDGSKGVKGYAHEVLEKLMDKKDFKCVYACGPEIMMSKVLDMCAERKVPCQLSLERYMKCGIGVCGSCTLAGMRVCKEGPVFKGEELAGTEFGSFTRDASGSRRMTDGC
ncbi:MAG: dihydroorotate dehydrogenase electron transfer subunit [Candidatus Altiarchaeota archaeon]